MQEGLDVGALIYPLLVVVGLCFIGLVAWLVIVLIRKRKRRETQPVKTESVVETMQRPQFTLAVGRSGSGWEIYVKGMPASADTVFDAVTRLEVLDGLKVLARYVRNRLEDGGAPQRAASQPAVKVEVSQTELPEGVAPPPAEISLTGESPGQMRSAGLTEYPAAPPPLTDMNLAQEIGEIVDELLSNTPELKGHAVDLINAQTAGINFVVDGIVYDAVEDIPNEEIQALIRRATREWELR
jgi:hypothetical protein